jgi:hypothetical protein
MLRAELDAAADQHYHAAQRYKSALKFQAELGSGNPEADEMVRTALRDETEARERYILHLKGFADFILNGHELPENTVELRRSLWRRTQVNYL